MALDANQGASKRKSDVRENSLPKTTYRCRGGGCFPDPLDGSGGAQQFVLPVVCFRRACPFLMAWSTFFFLFTISSFKAWRER